MGLLSVIKTSSKAGDAAKALRKIELEINNNDNNEIKIITNEAYAKDEYFCICKPVLCSPLYTSYHTRYR
jgi:hypothetical protein